MASSEGTADAHELTRALEDAIASLQQIKTQIRETEDLLAQDGLFKLLCAFRDSLAPYHMSLRHPKAASSELTLEQQLDKLRLDLNRMLDEQDFHDHKHDSESNPRVKRLRNKIKATEAQLEAHENDIIEKARQRLKPYEDEFKRQYAALEAQPNKIWGNADSIQNKLVNEAHKKMTPFKYALDDAVKARDDRIKRDKQRVEKEFDRSEHRRSLVMSELARQEAIRDHHKRQPSFNLMPSVYEQRMEAMLNGHTYRPPPGVTYNRPI
jgi:hypothetical protein